MDMWDWITALFWSFVIVAVVVIMCIWIDQVETCRDAGFDRRVAIMGKVYCIQAIDGIIEGKPLKVVKEQMADIAGGTP